MSSHDTEHRLAVIGFGPRGVGALEALATQAAKQSMRIKVDIYDPHEWLGAGPNFAPDQSALCILNIPVRALDIDPPDILANRILPFSEWSSRPYHADDFPPRSDIGAYLNARFSALCEATKGTLCFTHTDARVTGLQRTTSGWCLNVGDKQIGPYDEVLLTQGQPETKPDPQYARWRAHADKNDLDLIPAYPANTLIDMADNWADKTVAIRGLGLSTHDVLRLLTSGLGGKFQDGSYAPSGKEPRKILPFSLDGQPPAAKPATGTIDGWYDPKDAETRAFVTALRATEGLDPDDAVGTLCVALVTPAARILANLGSTETARDVRVWLDIEQNDPGTQETQLPVDTLKTTIDMAHAKIAPTAGYVIGQIWRKWQNELRKGVNAGRHNRKTAAALTRFDDGLKRFSYGPPVSAAEELRALIQCGLVSLCTVDDPTITLAPKGWRLREGDDGLLACVMIDAVLPNPDLDTITDPLLSACTNAGIVNQIADNLGAHTRPDGALVDTMGQEQAGISLLGRLALGSVIAVDSLHDCFGASTSRWAKGVVERLTHNHN